MQTLIGPEWKTYFINDMFQEEYQLVSAIKRNLLSDEQKKFLFDNDISIEDILNGRFSGDFDKEISMMLKDWNNKIGIKYFLNYD